MNSLYFALIFMVVMAVFIISVPFIKNKFSKSFIIFGLFIILFSGILYKIFGNSILLNGWITKGEEHYQLMTEYSQLGGIDGIINRIKEKIAANPSDAQGWFILGKLYLAKHDFAAAKEALSKAHQLAPENQEIERYYQQINIDR